MTGTTVGKKMVATITSTASKNFVQVTVDTDGKKGDAVGAVTATGLHPFWVPKYQRWVEAGGFAVGQGVSFAGGAEGEITLIRRWTAVAPVFNLTVDDIHTYYVMSGDMPVLVHNDSPVSLRSGQR